MKKMLFLMLFLLILGAANVSAQVRIGGNGQPNGAAVLDLNATDAINNGTKTLALPRVSLVSTTDKLGYTTLLNGMLVYNTNTTSGAGVYYWNGSQWVNPGNTYSGSTSISLSGTQFLRAALTGDVTAPENSNVTTISANAIDSTKIRNGSIGTMDYAPASITYGALKFQYFQFRGTRVLQPGSYYDTIVNSLPLYLTDNCHVNNTNTAAIVSLQSGNPPTLRVYNLSNGATVITAQVTCIAK